MNLQRRLVAEGIGTALLLAAVVGSGIMGERLAGGNGAIALLANTIATGSTLVALILTFWLTGSFTVLLRTMPSADDGGGGCRVVLSYTSWSRSRSCKPNGTDVDKTPNTDKRT